MRHVDFIIIGQGLAGTCLAWSLRARGASVVIIDNESPVSASRIAAGLMTPVTGQRLVKTWRFEELREAAWSFYHGIENTLGTNIIREATMLKVFQTPQELDYYERRRSDPGYQGLLSDICPPPDQIFAPLGCCDLLRGGQLHVPRFLFQSRKHFQQDGSYLTADIKLPEDVVLNGHGVSLPRWGLNTDAILFCEGAAGPKNPWFTHIEYQLARGEMLTVRLDQWNKDRIVHGGVWVAPVDDIEGRLGLSRIGATYDWSDFGSGPTAIGYHTLVERLKLLTHSTFEVVSHDTAVRPIVNHLHPVLGRHALHPQLVCFNGLASKGSLQAPYFADQLASHLIDRTPIENEVHVQSRFPVTGERR